MYYDLPIVNLCAKPSHIGNWQFWRTINDILAQNDFLKPFKPYKMSLKAGDEVNGTFVKKTNRY